MKTIAEGALLYENSLGRITHEPLGYLRLHWQEGLRGSESVRALFAQLLRAQLRTGCRHLLIDERLAAPFQEADKVWLAGYWLPEWVQQVGCHHAAHLAATDVFARLSSVGILAKARSMALSQRSFTTETEALQWLLSQPVSAVSGPKNALMR
ncbi:hypothetical protein [Hymenobacter sediminicola]|uniref:STAS/SEC14 domain-containing protein n=1 Tax=Hymenobacter sediminicola TaxID=2761579 RepID=A0A7G7W872_9BACT|nr:hypothetical protein [Hymenobacter sediminicola]QNH62565.1 hypothetical protein H4317_01680 [Hymenobacter sediminicola]